MKSEIELFNFEGKGIRTVEIDGKPYFAARDVAKAIGYVSKTSISSAINKHVSSENKGVRKLRTPGGLQKMVVVSEAGVYELAAKSKLPTAYPFQKWVFEEVLPSINHTGGYQVEQKPMTLDQQLSVISKASLETRNAVKQHTKEINELKENQTINPGEYSYLNRLVSKKVYEYAKNSTINFSKKQIGELFKDISNGIKQVSNIRTRSQIRSGQYNSVIDYVCAWVPSVATVQVVKNMQLDLEG